MEIELREVDVDPALGVTQRLDDGGVRARLAHTAQQAGARRHDHARLDAVRGTPIDLHRAAEAVGAATDDLRGHQAVSRGLLEVERLPERRVFPGRRVALNDLPAP